VKLEFCIHRVLGSVFFVIFPFNISFYFVFFYVGSNDSGDHGFNVHEAPKNARRASCSRAYLSSGDLVPVFRHGHVFVNEQFGGCRSNLSLLGSPFGNSISIEARHG